LRHAGIAEEQAQLDLHTVLGGVEIRVPESWTVVCQVSPMLGGVEDQTRPIVTPGQAAKRLVVSGSVLAGGVNIRN
jgi:hypothetical protein